MTSGKNSVKAAAATGDRIRGIHLTFPAPTIIEVLAQSANLDFVYIDGEHGCFDWRDIEIACITAERCGLTPIARIADRQVSTITRFLDRGVLGIVAPHVDTVEDAQSVVDAAYFAPLGNRSFGSGRPEYGAEISERQNYLLACNNRVSVCLMIESRAAIDNVGDLANLAGIDYFSFGMMDLSQDLGHPGNPSHPDVEDAVKTASARIHAAGKRVREDFMNFCWINDLLVAGAQKILGQADIRDRDTAPYGAERVGKRRLERSASGDGSILS